MAFIIADRVKETTLTEGLGAVVLVGVVSGYQQFSIVGDGNSTFYLISTLQGTTWEIGIGTYTASTNSLSRDTVLSSSNNNNPVSFPEGIKVVSLTQPAERAVYAVGSSIVAANGALLPAASGGTGQSSYAVGDLLYANTTTTLSSLADVVSGNALLSGGVGTAPAWGKIGLQTHVSGTLLVANGGTGATTSADALTNLGAYPASNPNGYTSNTGTVTSVGGTGTVSGLSLSGTVTTSGNLTLGGALDLSSPPVIGSTTPAAATFTTLTATGQTFLGGDATLPALRVNALSGITRYLEVTGSTVGNVFLQAQGSTGNPGFVFTSRGSGNHDFATASTTSNVQMRVSHTTTAVNYVQVTGAATGSTPTLSVQGSDADVGMLLQAKGARGFTFQTRGGGTPRTSFIVADSGAASVNYIQAQSNTTGNGPILSALGTDTNIDLALTPKGTGNVRFGTFTTLGAEVITGYITVKDSSGTIRKLAVIA